MKLFRRELRSDIEAAPAPTAADIAVIERIRRHGEDIHFGAPTRCPECGTYGFVDRVDLIAGTSANHCPSCRTEWRITQRALLEAAASATADDASRPVGNGILVRNLLAVAA